MPFERLALSRSTLDRTASRRVEPGLFETLAADPTALVVPVHTGQAPVVEGPHGPVLLMWPAPERPDLFAASTLELFLGTDLGTDGSGRAHVAVRVEEPPTLPEGARWAGLREIGAVLDDAGVGVLTTAVALIAWHINHPRCARCGSATEVAHAGWVRHCPVCGTEHYPRTDPAVIMAIVDADDRILLGRQATWPPKRFSTLAGFVEPGESLEDAVRREVAEESGVVVGEVTYRGSQPWPFPASLMLGFRGEALSTQLRPDGEELAQAAWWGREELLDDVRTGRLLLPSAVSIARRLIEDWFGRPLDEASGEPWR
jgi:NAD+ diphosphatase